MALTLTGAAAAFAAAFAAGAINSLAGGGTLITFPTLVFLGLPSVIANATSTVAIWPGSLGGMWGYRRELRGSPGRLLALVFPSAIGGLAGAALLRYTPTATFDKLVPYLILFATLLFMAQQPVQKLFGAPHPEHAHSSRWLSGAILFQLAVGLYGGYFGAGIGILMLAALAILGLTDIHQMNGWKNFFALCINGIAAFYFAWSGMVSWPFAGVMAVGAIAGGAGGAGIARRIGRTAVRRIVVAIGFGMAISLFLKK